MRRKRTKTTVDYSVHETLVSEMVRYFQIGLRYCDLQMDSDVGQRWETLMENARLGYAIRAKDFFVCHGCSQHIIGKPAKRVEVEEVDIDARTIYMFRVPYCKTCKTHIDKT